MFALPICIRGASSPLLLALLLPSPMRGQQPPAQATAPAAPAAQQVVQFGPFNVPQQVLNVQNQWTALLPVSSNADAEVLIEDVSAPLWLQVNADNFLSRGQYTLTVLSFYKTQRACRQDQIATGYSDSAHVDACNTIRYRIRQMAVDVVQSVVTVNFAAMVEGDGTLDPESIRQDTRSRGIKELDAQSQAAITKATAVIAKEAESYNQRQQGHR